MDEKKLLEIVEDLRALNERGMADAMSPAFDALSLKNRPGPVSGETTVNGAVQTVPTGDGKPASEDVLHPGRLVEFLAGTVVALGGRLVELKALEDDLEKCLVIQENEIDAVNTEIHALREKNEGMREQIDALEREVDARNKRARGLWLELYAAVDELENLKAMRGGCERGVD